MTANLLAHTDLFAAGIARSGAYNRTLTPFGFQSERRSFWEAPELYLRVSPFTYAHKINEPILLIHGEADNNSGTFPIQSERLYQALRGNGGTARYVVLPNEAHGYRARESVLGHAGRDDRVGGPLGEEPRGARHGALNGAPRRPAGRGDQHGVPNATRPGMLLTVSTRFPRSASRLVPATEQAGRREEGPRPGRSRRPGRRGAGAHPAAGPQSVAFSSSNSPPGPTRLTFTGTMPRAWVEQLKQGS